MVVGVVWVVSIGGRVLGVLVVGVVIVSKFGS